MKHRNDCSASGPLESLIASRQRLTSESLSRNSWCTKWAGGRVVAGLIFLMSLLLSKHFVQGAEPERPNIIIILADDLGVMDTSVPFLTDAAGQPQPEPLNRFYRTPHLVQLAENGIRFSQFYAMSVCSPSRVSLMTGQNSARHHVTNWINPEKDNSGPLGPRDWNWQGLGTQDVTVPRLLQKQGYRTIHIGKGHFGPAGSPGSRPENIGFDVSIGGSEIGHPGSYYGKDNYGEKTRHPVPGLKKYHGTDTFLTEALTLEAKEQITLAVREQQPFFLYFSHYAVHAPFQSDPRFAAHYQDSGRSKQAQAFATLVEGVDHSVGEVLTHLKDCGIAEKTLIVFLGDNGTDSPLGEAHEIACAAPLRGKKGSHHEGGMRVPMIAAWAAPNADLAVQLKLPIARGVTQTQLAAIYDLFPTVLQLVDAENPTDHPIDGTPLQKLFTGQPDPQHEQAFLMHYPHAKHRTDYFTSFRKENWKVIYHYFPTAVSNGSHYQLFDLSQDPSESHDMASTRPAVLAAMMQELVRRLDEEHAQFPVADEQGQKETRPEIP